MADQDGAPIEAGEDWRRTLMFMRTRRVLRDTGSAAAAAALIPKLGPKNLQAAAHNPDHSPLGRKAVESALRQKGGALRPWRVAVPGFLSAADLEDAEKLFSARASMARAGAGLAALVCAAALVPALFAGPFWFALTAAAVIVAGLAWGVLTAMRAKPARLMLLRRFEARGETNALTRAVAKELAPLGHVVGFTERPARELWRGPDWATLRFPNPLSAIVQALAAPVALARRVIRRDLAGLGAVQGAGGYRRMALRLGDRAQLNILSAAAGKEIMLVRANAAWRDKTIDLIWNSADAIIVDLSQLGEGAAWEFALIDPAMAARCVFVAVVDKADVARETLAGMGLAHQCHAFDSKGAMRDREAFRAALIEAMRATHAL
jgi:hypothetical protein